MNKLNKLNCIYLCSLAFPYLGDEVRPICYTPVNMPSLIIITVIRNKLVITPS